MVSYYLRLVFFLSFNLNKIVYLNQCRITLYAKSNEVKERDPNYTLIGERLVQDFSPTGRQQEGEEDEEKEDEEDVLYGATQGSLGDNEDEEDGNEADAEDEDEDEDKEEPGRKEWKLNQ